MTGLDALDTASPGTRYAYNTDGDMPLASGPNPAWLRALNEAVPHREDVALRPAAPDGTADRAGGSSFQTAQAEEPPEEEPLEPDARREEFTEDDLRQAELSSDPAVRARAYDAAKRELAKLDPTNADAGPEIAPQGWSPAAGDIERLRTDIADAKTAESLGLSPVQYRNLARDPDRGGTITAKGRQERDAAVAAWQSGRIRGPLVRDDKGADFRDADGRQWDVKSFNSAFRTGFSLPGSADSIDRELRAGEHVIVNTEDMSREDETRLRAEAQRRGWDDKVIFVNPNPLARLMSPQIRL
jgi:hypothetical protein